MIIILVVFYGLTGYLLEGIFNRVTMGSIIENKFKKNPKVMFCYSSIWMIPIFAICGLLISLIYHYIPFLQKYITIPLMMLIGALIADIIELGSGILLNKVFKLKIWDYSDSRFNILGQIDLIHTIGWMFLTLAICFKNDLIRLII